MSVCCCAGAAGDDGEGLSGCVAGASGAGVPADGDSSAGAGCRAGGDSWARASDGLAIKSARLSGISAAFARDVTCGQARPLLLTTAPEKKMSETHSKAHRVSRCV